MASRYDVLVLGDYYLDLVFSGLPAFPELGKEVFGSGFDMIPGGTYNAAVAMHRLGLKVGWATDFGDDEFSRAVVERARREGLDDALFVEHQRPLRRITVAASYPEDRAFITYCDPAPAVPAGMKALAFASARAVYVSGFYCGKLLAAGRALTKAKGMLLVMDGNSGEEIVLTDPAVRRAVESVDILLPNAREALRMTGRCDVMEALCILGELCPVVVVKHGAQGAYACHRGQVLHDPAIRVQPVDTTGAGDCFSAGFVKAWLSGLPLEQCLRWGNIVGGLSTTARGGTGRVVTARDVEQWLQHAPPE